MSKQIARRTSDRLIEQFGESIGQRPGCVVETITDAQVNALRTLYAQPNGGITANADGTFTARPAPPPPTVAVDPQAAPDKNTIASFMNAANGTATNAQRDEVLKSIIRFLRRSGQDA